MSKVIRTVKLTDDQFDRLVVELDDERAAKMMGAALMAAMKEHEKNRRRAWNTVHTLANTDLDKESVIVDWVNREVQVVDKDEEELEEDV